MSTVRFVKMAVAACVLSGAASSALALRGVVEQTITMPDERQRNFGSTVVELKQAAFDATQPVGIMEWANTGRNHWSWASGSSTVDAQREGWAAAEVAVCENLGFHKTGNYNPRSGMISARALADTLDVDVVSLEYTPVDNPLGSVKVEVVQKTYFKLKAKYASNGADDQNKYFYWRLVFTDVKEQINESTFQWQLATASASGFGAGVNLKINGQVEVNASWSATVDQGVSEFEYLSETRWENRRVVEFSAAGGAQTKDLSVDAGFNWDLHTNDANVAEVWQDVSKLNANADYYTVIGFGRIEITRNTDGSAASTAFHSGTDIGNPELLADRQVSSTVTYVRP